MKRILIAEHAGARYAIERDRRAGYCVFRFDGEGRCTHDYLQDGLDAALECAEEEFGVPRDRWVSDSTARAPVWIEELVRRLLPAMVAGEGPVLAGLREQAREVRIAEVESTGTGFFVWLIVAGGSPMVRPSHFTGGDADLRVGGLRHGADAFVHVRNGRLALFELYSRGGEAWPEAPEVEVGDVGPIWVPR